MSKRILVVGSINMDLVMKTPRVPAAGQTIRGETLALIPGGKGANQAVAVARLGLPVFLSGRVGRDYFGDTLLEGLSRNGVDTRHIERDAGAATGTAVIFVEPSGENTIVFAPGANGGFSMDSAAGVGKLLGEVDLVLAQLELPLEPVAQVIRLARAAGKPAVLDAGPPCAHPLPAFFQVTVLTPNEAEAEALTGKPIQDLDCAIQSARLLLEKGPEAVVLKLGAKGAFLATREGERFFPAHRVKAVDTTAAGDAFSAALSVALGEGKTLHKAVEVANAAGALAVTRLGAQPSLPTREELENFLKKA